MTKVENPTKRPAVRPTAIAISLALGVPGAAVAEELGVPLTRGTDMTRYDSNYVEIGGGYTSQDSYKFGEYTGLVDKGGFVIGNANVRKRFGDGLQYLNAWGYNLGLPSRQLGAQFGSQGQYWINAGFDQLTRYQYDDTLFLHNGLGGSTLTTPPGFTGIRAGTSQPPASAAAINPFLHEYDIKQERDVYKLGGGFYLGENWKISVNYRQDNRDGSKLTGAVMGSNGGNPRSAILPYQLSDRTQQIEAVASWTGKQGQVNLSYWYSKYDNDVTSLTWQNPYALSAGLAWQAGSGVGFPTGYGRTGMMPSNDFHQFQATGAWNFTPSTRLTSTFAYSLMKQDQAYLPYTINGPAYPGLPSQTPGTSLSVPNALPRNSLDGDIRNTLFDVSLTTRPISKLSLKLNYHYNNHDNKSSSDLYGYVGGDVTNQPAVIAQSVNNGAIRTNIPIGTSESRVKVDADYEIFRRTLLRGWYQYQRIGYNPAGDELRSSTNNNQLGVELRRIMSETFTGALRYTYDERRGTNFSTTRPYQASYTAATVAASPVDNVTTLRQFFAADYNRSLVGATGTFTPIDPVALSLRADWYQVDYKGPDCGGANDQVLFPTAIFPAECLGRTKGDGQSYTLDGSWTPAEGWTTFAFYTYQQYSTDQASRSWGGANSPTNAARDWGATLKYSDNTFGLGANFKPANRKYDVGLQYVFTDGTGKYDLSAGPGLPAPLPVPDTTYRLNSFQLYAKYQYSKNVLFRFNYWRQLARSNDWAYVNAYPTSSNNVLLTGQQNPNYNENVFGISVAYTGW